MKIMSKALTMKLTTEDEDGALTELGMMVAEKYAQRWVERAERDLNLERQHPELTGLFYDIRADAELAIRHATPAGPALIDLEVKKATDELEKALYKTFGVPDSWLNLE